MFSMSGLGAWNVAAIHPPSAQPPRSAAPIANNLQRIENAPGAAGNPSSPCDGTRAAHARDDTAELHVRRGRAFAYFLQQTNPNLAVATEMVNRAHARGTWDACPRVPVDPYLACATTRELTDAGKQALRYAHALFELTEVGHRVIDRGHFEAFARDLELDPVALLQALGRARSRLPEGSCVHLPRIEYTVPVNSRGDAAEARELNLPPGFIHYLDVVNPPLAYALDWLDSDPETRPAPSLDDLARTFRLGSTLHNYLTRTADGPALSRAGAGALDCELATFDWIRLRGARSDLPGLALAREIHLATLSRTVTRALSRLQAAGISA